MDTHAGQPQKLSEPLVLIDAEPLHVPGRKLCPKCAKAYFEASSCEQCGLVFDAIREGQEPWLRVAPSKALPLSKAEELWGAVAEAHQDDEAHRAFINHCLDNDLTDHGVRAYRLALANYPSHEALKQGLEELSAQAQRRILAINMSLERRPAADERKSKARMIMLAVSILLVIVALWVSSKIVAGIQATATTF